jgi:hypothetical protein
LKSIANVCGKLAKPSTAVRNQSDDRLTILKLLGPSLNKRFLEQNRLLTQPQSA